MSKLAKTFRIAAALLVAAFSGNLLPAVATYAASPNQPIYTVPTNGKISICHRTNSVTNPYNLITVSTSAADGTAGNSGNEADHYGVHKGPIASSQAVAQNLKNQHTNWGDIIPPIPGKHNGLNWSATGQAVLENSCNYVSLSATANVTVTPPTCQANSSATVTGLAHAALEGVLDQTVGSHTATFTASTGYLFTNSQATLTVPYTIQPKLTGEACETPKQPVAVPAAPETVDACNPSDVINNVTWANSLPANTATITWSQSPDSKTRTATLASDSLKWTDNTTAPKVFTLPADSGTQCPPENQDATPQAVISNDICGKKNDTYTIPDVEGVNYYINGILTAAGTYSAPTMAPRSLTVTTDAKAGYQLTEQYSETITFTNKKCPKVTICHRTNSVTNPYIQITVSANAVDGIAGNNSGKDHYGKHRGPLATSEVLAQGLKDQKIKWGDIIPPIIGIHDGLNWTDEGQAMYDNGCNYITKTPTPVTPGVPTTVNLCYDDSDYITIPETEGVTYKANDEIVSGNIPFMGSDIEITAEATEGYILEGYTDPWVFTSEDFASKDCLEIKKVFKSYEDTNHDGAITVGDTITWSITVTNTSDEDLDEIFEVEVKDLGITVALEKLGAGQTAERDVTTKLTADDMRACKATNTAALSAWRYTPVPSVTSLEAAANPPLATGLSNTAEYSFACPTPGKGSYNPPTTPEAPSAPLAPDTGVAAQLPQTGTTSAASIFALMVATLAYGALYASRRKFEQ